MRLIGGDRNKSAVEPGSQLVFPSNIVPYKESKMDSWMRNWANAIINYGQTCYELRDDANFRCARGIVNPEDFAHITDLVSLPNSRGEYTRTLPAKLRPVNAVAHAVNKMVGKIEAEGFDFSAHVINEDAVCQKLEDFSAEVMEKLTRFARQQSGVGEILGKHLFEQDAEPVVPKDVEEMSLSTFQQDNEIEVTKGLHYLMGKRNLFYRHKLIEQGFRNYVISGKMAFDTFIEDDPNIESIDPRQLIYELDSNSPFIQHGRYAAYYFNATPQELLDRCPELTDKDLNYLDELSKTWQQKGMKIPSPYWNYNEALNVFYLICYKGYLKANKRVRVKISPNRFDEDNPHVHFVDEKEQANEEKGEKIEYRYFNTIYEFQKMGEKIYYQMREMPGQHQSQDEPAYRELPLIGIIDPNPSIVDLVRPLQELRQEAFYVMERLIGQAKGKILVIDEATEENGLDNVYNMLSYGVYKVNTAREGDMQTGYQPMAPKEIDMGLSNAVRDLMAWVQFIDQNISLITGMNEASQGIVKSDQGLGVTQSAMAQAQITLMPYYSVFYTTVEMVLQAVCNLMRPAWAGKKKTAYFMGDAGYEFLNLHPESKWDLADYGVNVVNSVGANQAKQLMVQMAQAVLPTNQEPELALSIMKMARAKSDSETERIFTAGVNALRTLKNEEQKMAQQNQQQQMQIMAKKNDQEAEIEKTKAESPVQVALIKEKGQGNRQNQKLEHKEFEQTVKQKNEIIKKAAELIVAEQLEQKKAELNKEKEPA